MNFIRRTSRLILHIFYAIHTNAPSEQPFDNGNPSESPRQQSRQRHAEQAIDEIGVQLIGVGTDPRDQTGIDRPFGKRFKQIHPVSQWGNPRDGGKESLVRSKLTVFGANHPDQ